MLEDILFVMDKISPVVEILIIVLFFLYPVQYVITGGIIAGLAIILTYPSLMAYICGGFLILLFSGIAAWWFHGWFSRKY